METQQNTSNALLKYAANYGIILGLAAILFTTVDYVFKLYGSSSLLSWTSFLVTIAGIVFFSIMYRDKALGGYMSYGQSLIFGILLAIFSSFISGVFTLVLRLIDPAYMVTAMERAADMMAQKGMSDAQIEQAMKFTSFMSNPFVTFVFVVIGGTIMGTIISLITSIFTKKQKSIF